MSSEIYGRELTSGDKIVEDDNVYEISLRGQCFFCDLFDIGNNRCTRPLCFRFRNNKVVFRYVGRENEFAKDELNYTYVQQYKQTHKREYDTFSMQEEQVKGETE